MRNESIDYRLAQLSVFAVSAIFAVSALASEVDLTRVAVVGAGKECEVARNELSGHLARITGVKPGVTGDVTFVVGAMPPGVTHVSDFTAHVRRVGNRVYFWGDDSQHDTIKGHGTMNAVDGFLAKRLGVTWVRPGEDGIVVTPAKTVEIPDDFDWSYCPPLYHGELRWCSGKPMEAASRANLPTALRPTKPDAKRSIEERQFVDRHRLQWRGRFSFGHAYVDWLGLYYATHPEYFRLRGGKRDCRPNQTPWYVEFCVSNEAVVDQVITNWVARGKPQFLGVCPNDTRTYCQCEKCRALDHLLSPDEPRERVVTDRYVNFWNRIAAKAIALRPDVTLCTYAYAGYREPPRVERLQFPDNIIFGMVPMLTDDNAAVLEGWKRMGMKKFMHRPNYLCNWLAYTRGYERFLYENFKMNLAAGMIGCDYDGGPGDERVEFEVYVVARLIADPTLTFEQIEGDYLRQFGPAADVMRGYYAAIRARGERELYARQKMPADQVALDDTKVAGFVVRAHSIADLEGDIATLDRALATEGLSAVERRRLERRRLLAVDSLKSRQFLEADRRGESENALKIGLDLLAYRIRIDEQVEDVDWTHILRRQGPEGRIWMKPEMLKGLHAVYPEMYKKP